MKHRLKHLELSSVDLVRAGANQKADICLFKSAQPPMEQDIPIDDQTFLTYTDALAKSILSIQEDDELNSGAKAEMVQKSFEQFQRAVAAFAPGEPEDDPKEEPVMEPELEEIREIEKSDGDLDHIVEIEKFNPYHGKDGRFSTADGAGSFTYKPGQGAMYDRAIQREKERQAALSAQKGPAIAGVKPGAPMTHEQADAGRANPEYARPDKLREQFRAADKKLQDARQAGAPEEEIAGLKEEVNKRYQDWNQACRDVTPFQINCQSCVVAYEARRRGYDVEATGRNKKNQLQEALARNAASAWIDPKTGKEPEITKNDPKIRTAKQATKWLEENVEPDGRYEFSHGWKGTDGYNGHIVTVSRDSGGALQIFDPQSGKTYAGDDFTDYMSRVRSTYATKQYNPSKRSGVESVLHGRLGLIRVDGLEFNETVVNAVLKGAEQ